jgi:hypothetical protein
MRMPSWQYLPEKKCSKPGMVSPPHSRKPAFLPIHSVAKRAAMRGEVAMIKFNRNAMQQLLAAGEKDVIITGGLSDGTSFVGSTTLRVIEPGKNKGKGPKK